MSTVLPQGGNQTARFLLDILLLVINTLKLWCNLQSTLLCRGHYENEDIALLLDTGHGHVP